MQYWIHHLNDMSGSPLILAERLKKVSANSNITLITNQSDGFLSDWTGRKVIFNYTKHSSSVWRFFSLTRWYFSVFLYLLIHSKRGDILFLSTLVSSPLIALRYFVALDKITISINEIFFRVPAWNYIGLRLVKLQSVEKIYLSHYVKNYWDFGGNYHIEYPTLRKSIIDLSIRRKRLKEIDISQLNFFFVGSYIEAKGFRLFLEIAKYFFNENAKHNFTLFLSGSEITFQKEFPNNTLPKNLRVCFNDSSPEIFDNQDVFLGLTNINLWVETFGQTFAEAMIMRNICILPHIGAQLEYATDGHNAFLFTDHSIDGILTQIDRVISLKDHIQFAETSHKSMIDFFNIESRHV